LREKETRIGKVLDGPGFLPPDTVTAEGDELPLSQDI
jgi:hypothetical protein